MNNKESYYNSPFQSMDYKTFEQLMVGDVIEDSFGEVAVISKISKGFERNSIMITWNGGFACQPKNFKIKVLELV